VIIAFIEKTLKRQTKAISKQVIIISQTSLFYFYLQQIIT